MASERSDQIRTADQIRREMAYYARQLSTTTSVSRKERAARRLDRLRAELARRGVLS